MMEKARNDRHEADLVIIVLGVRVAIWRASSAVKRGTMAKRVIKRESVSG